MVTADIAQMALELAPEERLELARRLIESVVTPEPLEKTVHDGIRRIEDVLTGKVKGLSENEFRSVLG